MEVQKTFNISFQKMVMLNEMYQFHLLVKI
jgi:hypothetical protein